jgi:alpha-ketoglutarate-dependent taurine dioxygenase
VVQPRLPGLSLATWLGQNKELVGTRLREHGGLLFRGFIVGGPPEFEQCIKAVSGELLEYVYRSTPRTRVSGAIYTSTSYPPSRSIPLHNEMSYSNSWPLKIWFQSVQTAVQGGRTPLADSRRVFNRISPAIREKFARRRVMYVRNYGQGLDLPWQEVFQTAEKAEVESLCRRTGIDFVWTGDDGLTTRQTCQGVATHPQTGEQVWFNQAHLFHVSSLDPDSRDLLIDRFTEAGLPRHAFYGDGEQIETSFLDEIREAYARETVLFPWKEGDVLFLDNMLTAHGREPFEGPRKVLAGMAERCGGDVCVEM